MHYAAYYGNLQTLKYLIQLGGNPFVTNAQNLSLFHVAAQTDQLAITSYLLSLGFSVD